MPRFTVTPQAEFAVSAVAGTAQSLTEFLSAEFLDEGFCGVLYQVQSDGELLGYVQRSFTGYVLYPEVGTAREITPTFRSHP